MPNTQYTDGVSTLIKHKWKIALAIIILLITVMFLYIILRLIDGIIIGIVLAYVARPLKHFIDRYVPRISSYLATMAVVLPIFLIIGFGIIEIFNFIVWAVNNQSYVMGVLLNLIERLDLPEFARDRTKDIIANITSYILLLIGRLSPSDITNAIENLVIVVLDILIAIFLCFYLLIDGGRLVDKIMEIIPDDVKDFSRRFMSHFDGILSALFIGNFYSAIAVGILSLIVFWAFDFANVLALSALMLVAAIIPIFAGWMVIAPLAIYRYFEVGSESAITFIMVCILVIIIPTELLIRPFIINYRSNIHPMLIIIAFIGGGLVGGIAGFFIAPILLGAIVAAYRANAELKENGVKPE